MQPKLAEHIEFRPRCRASRQRSVVAAAQSGGGTTRPRSSYRVNEAMLTVATGSATLEMLLGPASAETPFRGIDIRLLVIHSRVAL